MNEPAKQAPCAVTEGGHLVPPVTFPLYALRALFPKPGDGPRYITGRRLDGLFGLSDLTDALTFHDLPTLLQFVSRWRLRPRVFERRVPADPRFPLQMASYDRPEQCGPYEIVEIRERAPTRELFPEGGLIPTDARWVLTAPRAMGGEWFFAGWGDKAVRSVQWSAMLANAQLFENCVELLDFVLRAGLAAGGMVLWRKPVRVVPGGREVVRVVQ
jgi:hypothetical protein